MSQGVLPKESLTVNPEWGSAPVTVVSTARYTSRKWAEAENRDFWPRMWQMACRLEQIPEAGDYYEYVIADKSYLVVRVDAETVKAFPNACLHRGTKLKTGSGSAMNLTCPFHAWSWALDGACTRVLDPEDFPGLEKSELQLPECQVGLWGGFVFVNPDPDAPSFEDYIKPIADVLAPYRLEDLRLTRHRSAIVACNWKVTADAFEETYHALGTHPQLLISLDDVNTRYETYGPHSTMATPFGLASPRTSADLTEDEMFHASLEYFMGEAENVNVGGEGSALGDAFESLREMELPEGVTGRETFMGMLKMFAGDQFPDVSDEELMCILNATVFPNLGLSCAPGQCMVMRFLPNGDNPDSAIFELMAVALPGMLADAGDGVDPKDVEVEIIDDAAKYDWGQVFNQDIQNMPKIQAGMHNVPTIRFSGYQEKRPALRHKILDQYISSDMEMT